MIQQIWSKTPQVNATFEVPANNTEMNQGNLKLNKIMLLKNSVFLSMLYTLEYVSNDVSGRRLM